MSYSLFFVIVSMEAHHLTDLGILMRIRSAAIAAPPGIVPDHSHSSECGTRECGRHQQRPFHCDKRDQLLLGP